MPSTCSVPNCDINTKNAPKGCVFRFSPNKEVEKKWIGAINRQDFQPSKNSKVYIHNYKSTGILNKQNVCIILCLYGM